MMRHFLGDTFEPIIKSTYNTNYDKYDFLSNTNR